MSSCLCSLQVIIDVGLHRSLLQFKANICDRNKSARTYDVMVKYLVAKSRSEQIRSSLEAQTITKAKSAVSRCGNRCSKRPDITAFRVPSFCVKFPLKGWFPTVRPFLYNQLANVPRATIHATKLCVKFHSGTSTAAYYSCNNSYIFNKNTGLLLALLQSEYLNMST